MQRVTSAEEALSLQDHVIIELERFLGVQQPASFFTVMQQKLFDKTVKAVHARYQTEPGVACFIGWVSEGPFPGEYP